MARKSAAPVRRSSSGPSRSGSPPMRTGSPASRTPAPPAPSAPLAPAPAQGGGMLSGLGATIAQGFAFGTGSAIAHRAVGAVAESFSGGSSNQQPSAVAPTPAVEQSRFVGACDVDQRAFMQCLQQNQGNVQSCDYYYNALQSCQSAQEL